MSEDFNQAVVRAAHGTRAAAISKAIFDNTGKKDESKKKEQ